MEIQKKKKKKNMRLGIKDIGNSKKKKEKKEKKKPVNLFFLISQ